MTNISDKLLKEYKNANEKSNALFNKLVNMLQDSDFRSVFALANAHNFNYRGPEVAKEAQELDAALKAVKAAEVDENKALREEQVEMDKSLATPEAVTKLANRQDTEKVVGEIMEDARVDKKRA